MPGRYMRRCDCRPRSAESLRGLEISTEALPGTDGKTTLVAGYGRRPPVHERSGEVELPRLHARDESPPLVGGELQDRVRRPLLLRVTNMNPGRGDGYLHAAGLSAERGLLPWTSGGQHDEPPCDGDARPPRRPNAGGCQVFQDVRTCSISVRDSPSSRATSRARWSKISWYLATSDSLSRNSSPTRPSM